MARFRSLGKQTGLGYQISSEARREIKAQSRTIEKYLESIEKKAYNLAKDFETKYNTTTSSEAGQKYYLDQIYKESLLISPTYSFKKSLFRKILLVF